MRYTPPNSLRRQRLKPRPFPDRKSRVAISEQADWMARQRECGPDLEKLDDVEVLDCGDRRADSGQHAPYDCAGEKF